MGLGTRWKDAVIDAVEQSVVRHRGHKSSAGVSQPVFFFINSNIKHGIIYCLAISSALSGALVTIVFNTLYCLFHSVFVCVSQL